MTGSKGALNSSENTRPAASSTSAVKGPRTPRRAAAHATRLEALDDSLGPLGPLGENSSTPPEPEHPPLPPLKEQSLPTRTARHHASPPSPMNRSMGDPVDAGEDDRLIASRIRYSSQGQPSPVGAEGFRRQTQSSVSIEQAARPSFEITVGDPHKVGDITSSHIVYQVRTKVLHRNNFIVMISNWWLILCRRLQRHIKNRNLRSVVDTEIFFGYTILCTATIQGS